MAWKVDIDYHYTSRSEAVTRINSLSSEEDWEHIGITALKAGGYNIDSDWTFADLQAVMTRIQAQAQIVGFIGASLKLA